MSQQNDFPEVSEFLQKMQIRKSMFGYDKEDVMLKMQQLDRLYQKQMLLMKGQMEEVKAAAAADGERVRREMEERLNAMREQLRREELEKLHRSMDEKQREHKKELRMLGEELNRQAEQLISLRGRIWQMTSETEKK